MTPFDSPEFWLAQLDRKRLFRNAIGTAAGGSALASAAASAGVRSPALATHGEATKGILRVAAVGGVNGFDVDNPAIQNGATITVGEALYDALTDLIVPPTLAAARHAATKGPF